MSAKAVAISRRKAGHYAMKVIAIFAFASISTSTYGQTTQSSFEDLVNAAKADMNAYKQEYYDYADSVTTAYEKYQKAVMDEFKAHCEKVQSKWGDEEAVESSNKDWVEYNDDQTERSVVDFESGTVKVELLLSPEELKNQALVDEKMAAAVDQLITSKGKSLNYNSKLEKQRALSDTPILSNQIDLSKYGVSAALASAATSSVSVATPATPTAKVAVAPVMPSVSSGATALPTRGATATTTTTATTSSKSNNKKEKKVKEKQQTVEQTKPVVVETPVVITPTPTVEVSTEVASATTEVASATTEVAKTIVQEVTPTTEIKDNGEGEKVAVVTLTLELAEDHINTRAVEFKDIVDKYSEKFDVDRPIIYAIMEQESYFNPAAKSWVPAYGLMQLVPTSGGRDAYNYVYKEDIIPTAEYLYEPDHNIELGTAYIKRVRTAYFSKVVDQMSQLLCVIASYNCGAGNVGRAMIGTTNIFNAIDDINALSYDELYAKLRKDLPEETQNYIYKVTENIKKYSLSE